MYVINEWFERYECNASGGDAKPGDKLRAGPLRFIKSKIYGTAQSAGFAAMQQIAGPRAYEVFGLFQKFLEIAGSMPADKRGGVLRSAKGRIATSRDLAAICRTTVEAVEFALQTLIIEGVEWIVELPDSETPEIHGNSGEQEFTAKLTEIPEIPGNSGALRVRARDNSTQLNTTQRNENENETQLNSTERARAQAREEPPEAPPADSTIPSEIARAFSSSARLGLDFGNSLRKLLQPKSKEDLTALWNAQHWAERYGPEMAEKMLEIAKKSRTGRNPLAVFFSRLEKELGYRPRAERDKIKPASGISGRA